MSDKPTVRTPGQHAFARWYTDSADWLRRVGVSKEDAWSIYRDGWHEASARPPSTEANGEDAARLDWLEQNATSCGDHEGFEIRIPFAESEQHSEGFNTLRDLIDAARLYVQHEGKR